MAAKAAEAVAVGGCLSFLTFVGPGDLLFARELLYIECFTTGGALPLYWQTGMWR